MKIKELTKLFEEEVSDHSNEIDPHSNQDWYGITLGWGIGKGLKPEEAQAFSLYIKYNTELGYNPELG